MTQEEGDSEDLVQYSISVFCQSSQIQCSLTLIWRSLSVFHRHYLAQSRVEEYLWAWRPRRRRILFAAHLLLPSVSSLYSLTFQFNPPFYQSDLEGTLNQCCNFFATITSWRVPWLLKNQEGDGYCLNNKLISESLPVIFKTSKQCSERLDTLTLENWKQSKKLRYLWLVQKWMHSWRLGRRDRIDRLKLTSLYNDRCQLDLFMRDVWVTRSVITFCFHVKFYSSLSRGELCFANAGYRVTFRWLILSSLSDCDIQIGLDVTTFRCWWLTMRRKHKSGFMGYLCIGNVAGT